MKPLLIFDSPEFSYKFFRNSYDNIEVFPLTANWNDIDLVRYGFKTLNINLNILDSASLINDEASLYRERLIEWASVISDFKIKSKTLRHWFLLSDRNISAWWFGLLGDKSPSKSRLFIKIAQTAAILKQIKILGCDIVFLAFRDRKFQKQLKTILEAYEMKCQVIKLNFSDRNFLDFLKDFLRKQRIFRSLYTFATIITNTFYLKKILGHLNKREKKFNDALLFFTYFPSLIKSDAESGRFRNKFAIILQDICELYKKMIVWIVFYTPFDNYSFKDAVKLAKRFIHQGQHLFFWMEFLDPKNLLKAFQEYMRLTSTWYNLRRQLNNKLISDITGNDFVGNFFLETIDESFHGGYYLNGIIQYEAFKNIFKELSGFSHGIYTCEMMGWEYAFIAAKRIFGEDFPVIGYQDSAISSNMLQMFHSKEELKYKNTPDGIPLPEIIASCGRIPQAMLEKYYDRISNLETIRFRYISEFMQSTNNRIGLRNNKFIFLVCTSIYLDESKAMANLVNRAFGNNKELNFEIWFKGHPSLTIEKIFEEAGITINNKPYKIKEGMISDFLCKSNAVLVGTSSVAIEALAFGCEVLVYLNVETLNQSPLIGYEEYYYKVYDPHGLRASIERLRLDSNNRGIAKKQEFVKIYFNLNHSLKEWKKVLDL